MQSVRICPCSQSSRASDKRQIHRMPARMGHRVTLHRIAMAVRAGTYIMRRRSATSSPPDGHCRGAPFVASRGTLGSLPRWTCSNGSKSRSAARRLLPSCVRRVHALLSAHLEAVCRNISPCTIVDISAFRASAFDARRERRVQLAIASRIAPSRTRRPDLLVSSRRLLRGRAEPRTYRVWRKRGCVP